MKSPMSPPSIILNIFSGWNTQLNEPTNQNSHKLLIQRIWKRYDKTLRTSVANSLLSPFILSPYLCLSDRLLNIISILFVCHDLAESCLFLLDHPLLVLQPSQPALLLQPLCLQDKNRLFFGMTDRPTDRVNYISPGY